MKWKCKREERDITLVMSVLLKMITQESSHSLSLSFYTICVLFHSTSLHVHTAVQCSGFWYYERNMKSTLLRLLYLVSELCIRNLQGLFGIQSTSVWVNSISPVLVHVWVYYAKLDGCKWNDELQSWVKDIKNRLIFFGTMGFEYIELYILTNVHICQSVERMEEWGS